METALVLTLIALLGYFAYISKVHEDEIIQGVFFILSYSMAVALMGQGVILTRNYATAPLLVNLYIPLLGIIGMIYVFLIYYTFKNISNAVMQKVADAEKEKHDRTKPIQQ